MSYRNSNVSPSKQIKALRDELCKARGDFVQAEHDFSIKERVLYTTFCRQYNLTYECLKDHADSVVRENDEMRLKLSRFEEKNSQKAPTQCTPPINV